MILFEWLQPKSFKTLHHRGLDLFFDTRFLLLRLTQNIGFSLPLGHEDFREQYHLLFEVLDLEHVAGLILIHLHNFIILICTLWILHHIKWKQIQWFLFFKPLSLGIGVDAADMMDRLLSSTFELGVGDTK